MSEAVVIFIVGMLLLFIFVGLPMIAFSIMLNGIFSQTGACYRNKDNSCTESSKSECDGIWYDSPWKCASPSVPRACYEGVTNKCRNIGDHETCNGRIFKDIQDCQTQLK